MSTNRGSVASVEDRNDSATPGSGRKSQTSPRASPRGSTASPRASVRSPKEEDSSPREGTASGFPQQGGEKDDHQAGPEDTPKRVPIIDRGPVSSFFAVAVMVNTATIGIDTQIQASGASAGADTVMLLIELTFFGIFTIELILRIIADRCPKFLYNSWNLLDAFLVSSSGVDIIFKVVLKGGESGADDMGKLRAFRLLKVTRIVRLLRVLRLFRFKKMLRMLRGLVMLMFAIIGALRNLGWVALMFTITTYIIAIVTTEFLGVPNTQLEKQGLKDDLIDEWFGDMPKSMFTLLQLATLEDWAHIARHSGAAAGGFWSYFFLVYVMATNSILMNVVLATLIENLFTLSSDMKEAHAGEREDAESWMVTPSELASDEDDDGQEDDEHAQKNQGNSVAGPNTQQSAVDRLAMQTLSEFFDLAAQYVGQEGLNQQKLVTNKSLKDALTRPDVQSKVYQAVPAMKGVDPEEMAKKIWGACPKHLNAAGLTRQELQEACMILRGELSMNHFVVISQSLHNMDKHIGHQLVHLNKHQRKMNRRFLKLRHRLRKVYHFDGTPKKVVEMMNEMKRKQMAAMAHAQQSGQAMPSSPNMGGAATETQVQAGLVNDGSSVIELSNDSSKSGDEDW